MMPQCKGEFFNVQIHTHTAQDPLVFWTSHHPISKYCRPLWRQEHVQAKIRLKWLKRHEGFGPPLEARMSKNCTPLWRKAHFEVGQMK